MDAKPLSRTKARLIIVVVFLVGVAVGGLSMNLYERASSSANRWQGGGGRSQDRLLEKMTGTLKLTGEQTEQMRAILNETFDQYDEIKRDIEPRFDGVRQKSRERMRAVLKPEQLSDFEKMVQDSDARRQKWRDKMK